MRHTAPTPNNPRNSFAINHPPIQRTVLAQLRALNPERGQIGLTEALHTAELQASMLLAINAISDGTVPIDIITNLPKLRVEHTSQRIPGVSFWDRTTRQWVIQLAQSDTWEIRRMTIAREFKHIIDYGQIHLRYRGTRTISSIRHADLVARYFAGCLLVPSHLLKHAWKNGIRAVGDLSDLFMVSEQAIVARLRETGLIRPNQRPRRAVEHIQDRRTILCYAECGGITI